MPTIIIYCFLSTFYGWLCTYIYFKVRNNRMQRNIRKPLVHNYFVIIRELNAFNKDKSERRMNIIKSRLADTWELLMRWK